VDVDDQASFDALVANTRTLLAVFAFPKDTNYHEAKAWEEAADRTREYAVKVVRAATPDAARLSGVGAVLLKPQWQAPPAHEVYSAAHTTETIFETLKAKSFSGFGELSPDSFKAYTERGLPLGWTFSDPDATDWAQSVDSFARAAEQVSDVVSLAWTNASKFSRHFRGFGCEEGKLPCFVLQHEKKRFRMVKAHHKPPPSTETVVEFVKGVLDGSVKPWVKSEPVPKNNDAPVTVVVSDSFDDEVMKDKRPVLLEFYAPWCNHCQQFAPIYEKFAATVRQQDLRIKVAKIDGAANDVDELHPIVGEKLKGFPTVFWFPGGKDKKTVDVFEGERSEQALLKFIQSKGVRNVKVGAQEL